MVLLCADDRTLGGAIFIGYPQKCMKHRIIALRGPSRIAGRYKVHVTPTVLFVDSHGEEIAKRLVGVASLDFYGGYLDAALVQSRNRLHELGRCH